MIATGVAYFSGGSYAPGAWIAWNAAISAGKTFTIDIDQYLSIMDTTLDLRDTAMSNIEAALNGDGNAQGGKGTMILYRNGVVVHRQTHGYNYEYNDLYMPFCAGHLSVSTDWLWDQVNMQGVTGPYYHNHGAENMAESEGRHLVSTMRYWKVKEDLDRNYQCEGSCSDMFRTPQEAYSSHLARCVDYNTSTFTDACKDTWHTCDSNHLSVSKLHTVSYCVKEIMESLGGIRSCGAAF